MSFLLWDQESVFLFALNMYNDNLTGQWWWVLCFMRMQNSSLDSTIIKMHWKYLLWGRLVFGALHLKDKQIILILMYLIRLSNTNFNWIYLELPMDFTWMRQWWLHFFPVGGFLSLPIQGHWGNEPSFSKDLCSMKVTTIAMCSATGCLSLITINIFSW